MEKKKSDIEVKQHERSKNEEGDYKKLPNEANKLNKDLKSYEQKLRKKMN